MFQRRSRRDETARLGPGAGCGTRSASLASYYILRRTLSIPTRFRVATRTAAFAVRMLAWRHSRSAPPARPTPRPGCLARAPGAPAAHPIPAASTTPGRSAASRHVPGAAPAGAADPTQRVHRFVDPAPCIELALVEVRLPSGARHPQDWDCPQRSSCATMKRLGNRGPHRASLARSSRPVSILPSVSTVR